MTELNLYKVEIIYEVMVAAEDYDDAYFDAAIKLVNELKGELK